MNTNRLQISPALMEHISEMIYLCYQNIAAAIEYANGVRQTPRVPGHVVGAFVNVVAELKNAQTRIDRLIPKDAWEEFDKQVKQNDALRFDAIKDMYIRMLPEQQQMVEVVCKTILTKEFQLIEEETVKQNIDATTASN